MKDMTALIFVGVFLLAIILLIIAVYYFINTEIGSDIIPQFPNINEQSE